MPTLAQMIEKAANPDRVEYVVIDTNQLPGYDHGNMPLGIVLPWASGAQWLEYEPTYDYAAFYAWTESKIIFLSTYDTHYEIHAIPRHPESCLPEMFGG